MEFGSTFFIVAILIVFVWVFIEVKRLKHKLLAIFIIGLILFTYISFSITLKDQDIDIKTFDGMIQAGKLYKSWLITVFASTKSVTAYATKQDWTSYDESVLNETTRLEEMKENAEEIWEKLG